MIKLVEEYNNKFSLIKTINNNSKKLSISNERALTSSPRKSKK